jgi:hypothetical protein
METHHRAGGAGMTNILETIEYVKADTVRAALKGHKCSELFGESGLIAATMRDLDITISERDAAIAERDEARQQRDRLVLAIENHKAKAFPLTGEDFDQELWSAIKTN